MKKKMKYGTKMNNGVFALLFCSFLFVSCTNPWVTEILYRNDIHIVTFNADNGSALSTQKVKAGSKASKPSNPFKEGYDFDYWLNIATNKEWNFNTVVTADVTLKAKWTTVPYILRLDIAGLAITDTVSFSATESVIETAAVSGTVPIYYTLSGGHATDKLEFSFHSTESVVITDPETKSITYTVNPNDALNGIITIMAQSVHTDFNHLDAPTGVSFTKNGTITFTPGANNDTAGSTYTYTLYKDGTPISGFTDKTITSGTTDADLAARMLSKEGAYTVRIKAHTDKTAYYTSPSFASDASNAVNVYLVKVTITGAIGADKITVNVNGTDTDPANTFAMCVFDGDTVTLTAMPGEDRKVTWSDGVVEGNVYRIEGITENKTIEAVFAAKPVITKDDFNLTNDIKIYNGNPQSATVEYKEGTGVNETTAGTITVYYTGTDGASYAETPPINAGTYAVSVTTSGGTNYAALTVKTQIGFFTILQTLSPDRIEYYWVDQHDNLVTTNDGATTIAPGSTLTITAQTTGYIVKQWYLDGLNTGQTGNTYNFSSATTGKHIVSVVVEKNGKPYNTNIIITVQ